ncbi:MAG: HAD family hydrolase [Lachnospiraceae bacterium]|nr:HAD family hydrolase [Lachnospiraceae bacterium]
MADFIFDIDGTIWNTTGVVATAWNEAVKDSNIEELKDLVITDKLLQKEFGKPMNVIADDVFGDIDKKVKADLLEKCCHYEHEAIAKCEENITYDKVYETIVELSKNNNLYICSNCQEGYIELVMEKNNITDYIKDFECYGHTLLSKGQNIKLLVERNNMKNPIYVGDTMGDYEATVEAGVPFIHCTYGFGKVENPYMSIDSFDELLKVK